MILLFFVSMMVTSAYTTHSHAAQANLAWDAVAGSPAGYRLFARAEGQDYNYGQPSWQGTSTSCTVHQLAEGTMHYFVVRAFDSHGAESANSNEVVFAAAAASPPKDETPKPPDMPTEQSPASNADNVPLEPKLVTSPFKTSYSGDYHAHTRWQVLRDQDGVCVFDLYSNKYLTSLEVPPLVLDGGTTYLWLAQHYNQGGSASPPSAGMRFTTVDWPEDSDGNGIPDSQEISTPTDLDRNKQSDDQQPEMKRFNSAVGHQQIGIQVSASKATVRLEAVQSIDESSVSNPSPVQPEFPAGLYNFKVAVDSPGETVVAKVHFSDPVPAVYHFYKFDPALGYVDYGTRSMIAPNETTATFQIQDGGEGDMDGVANGVIVVIGGYGTAPTSAGLDGGGKSSGGGGGCFIMSIARP